MMASSMGTSKPNVLWFCCNCHHGEMPQKLQPSCEIVNCQHKKCVDCLEESMETIRKTKGALYTKPKRNDITVKSKAPRNDCHEALRETHPTDAPDVGVTTCDETFLGLLPHTNESPVAIPEPAPQIRQDQGQSESTGYFDPGGDGESTPRSSCAEFVDPSDLNLNSNARGDDIWESQLLGLSYSPNFGDPSPSHHNPSLYFNDPYQDAWVVDDRTRTNRIESTESQDAFSTNGVDQFGPLSYEPGSAFGYTCPAEHQELISGSDAEVNVTNSGHALGRHYEPPQQLIAESIPSFPTTAHHMTTSHQMPGIRPVVDQDETFTSLRPSFPKLTTHEGSHRQHSAGKRKFSQGGQDEHVDTKSTVCKDCLPATEKNTSSLACHFFKYNPEQHLGCSGKKFKGISPLMQHLKNEHGLKLYDCKSYLKTFGNENQHKICQLIDSNSVVQVRSVTKARLGSVAKWHWIWKTIFGDNIPKPTCPYLHTGRDIRSHIISRFLQYLRMKGTDSNPYRVEAFALEFVNLDPVFSNDHPLIDHIYPSAYQTPMHIPTG